MLEDTYPEKSEEGYTKYQQAETTHKYGLSPRLIHASDKLSGLWKPQNREEIFSTCVTICAKSFFVS